jgi:hypothetical protein
MTSGNSNSQLYVLFVRLIDSISNLSVKVMAIAAVMVTDLFVGLNTNVWTAWVFFAVLAGIVIIWIYTVRDLI